MEKISAAQAAKLLGISIDSLGILEKQGIVHSTRNTEGVSLYSSEEIAQIKSRGGLTLSEEAAQVGIGIQRDLASSVTFTRKVLMLVGGALSGYVLLVAVLTALFIVNPLQTAQWLGIVKIKTNVSLGQKNQDKQVLGVETSVIQQRDSPIQTILQPVGKVSLGLVKNISPQSYVQVSKVAILDTNDVLILDSSGAITPNRPINLPESSLLQVGTNQVVPNLNSQYLQGKQPGKSPGDIAIVGEAATPTLTPVSVSTNPSASGLTNANTITGLTASNLTAGDFSSKINSGTYAFNITGSAGSFGGSLSGDVTGTQGSTAVTKINGAVLGTTSATSGNLLIGNGSAWVTQGLTGDATITSGGVLSLKNTGTPGTYGSAVNIPVFVTDAQGRITSVTNTTISGLATSNFGSTNISQWTNNSGFITTSSTDSLTNKSISGFTNTLSNIPNSALTNSALTVFAGTGLTNGGTVSLGGTVTLSLPNVGTSGTYGNAATIPVITTDPQGRISGVTTTGISGLTASNLTTGDYSAVITSGTYGINISGNAATANSANSATSATNFSGSLVGDVTGAQSSTTVANINGNTLGLTTPTAGNVLIGNGASWITKVISNDATIDSSGVLTLKGVGTAGTYGSATLIPAITIDAQGRVTGVINTTISGLTNSNLSGSAGITNANLANSSLTVSGNSGSASVALGGTLTLNGSGITNITASGSTLTIASTEADTLQSVYGRGNTITNSGTGDTLLITDAANANIDSLTRRSLLINPGAITQNTGGSTGNYIGLDITMPSFTLASGTALNGYGIRVTTNGLTQTAGTLTNNGLLIDSTSSTITTGGTLNGLKINPPTTMPSVGTYNNVFLGTSTGATVNTIDQATIAVGNIASTAQNNFSTLNITNGGTGYLDLELVRGFINFQNMNTLSDDFTGNTLDTNSKWVATATGGQTTCGILPGGLNGLLRLHTGNAANRGCELTTQTITTLANGYYQRGNNPIFETKLKIDTPTSARINVGFTDTRVAVNTDTTASSNHAYIGKKAADTKWQCITDDGGATETTTDTGVTIIANTFYRLRVELRNGTTPQVICTVDDGTTVTRTAVTTHLPAASSAMDLYVRDNQSDSVTKNMDVDYVRVWQDDPNGMVVNTEGSLTPITSASDAGNVSTMESTSSAITTPKEPIASNSATFNLITDTIGNLFKNAMEFFGKVIFHTDVAFLGRPTFNKDTAGHAQIKAGGREVNINFEKEYASNPVVTASLNLVGGVNLNDIPSFAVYDLSSKGFKIKLSKEVAFDLNFSWIALAVNEDNISTSTILNIPILSTTPGSSPVTSETQPQTVISPTTQQIVPNPIATASASPSTTSSPSQQIVPSPIATASASPSASTI